MSKPKRNTTKLSKSEDARKLRSLNEHTAAFLAELIHSIGPDAYLSTLLKLDTEIVRFWTRASTATTRR